MKVVNKKEEVTYVTYKLFLKYKMVKNVSLLFCQFRRENFDDSCDVS